MTCINCEGLSYIPIKTPQKLSQVIAFLKQATQKEEFIVVGKGFGCTPFHLLRQDQWDDWFGYYFKCASCQQPFYLSAETYHGSGGAFKAIEVFPDDMEVDSI